MVKLHVTVQANAKLNLILDIIGKRPDGFHSLTSIMQSVDLHDIVVISTDRSGKIGISCDNTDLPLNEDNTAYKAAALYLSSIGQKAGVNIRIDKRIPVSAGLAGGSADAAAVLLGLNEIFGRILDNEKLAELGAKVGADLPFCLIGGTALAEGIGDILTPIKSLPACCFVIVKPCKKMSTAFMYSKYDMTHINRRPDTKSAVKTIQSGDIYEFSKHIYNVFEAAWDDQAIQNAKNALLNQGALAASLTGSGPCVFGLFACEADAKKCCEYLKNLYSEVYVCKPTNFGCKIIEVE